MWDICSKLTTKTPQRRHWQRSGIFIVNFEQILHIILVISIDDLEQVNAACEYLLDLIFLHTTLEMLLHSLSWKLSEIIINPLIPSGNKRPQRLKQTCSSKLQVC